jgi:general secretion pathway protein K
MRRPRGFAVLIVLLAMGFLALLAMQITASGRSETRVSQDLITAASLEVAAEGAIRHAAFEALAAQNPQFRPGPSVHEIRVGSVTVLVRLQNEADRVNLNTGSLVLLQALMVVLGTPPAQAAHGAASILDWRTSGDMPRPNGARTPQYRAAGLGYGPPGTPFQSVDELRYVLGMTPGLFAKMAPHLTVWTDGDPDLSTQDAVVAEALVDTGGTPEDATSAPDSQTDTVLRVTALAIDRGGARSLLTEVVTIGIQDRLPKLRILFRSRCEAPKGSLSFASCV